MVLLFEFGWAEHVAGRTPALVVDSLDPVVDGELSVVGARVGPRYRSCVFPALAG